jgi:hypothetical protein
MVIFEQLLPAFFVSQTLNTSFDVALKKWNFFDWKAFDYGVIKNDALQNPIVHSAIMNSMSLGCNVFGSGLWDLAFKNAKTSTVKNCENFSLGLINPTLPEQAMSLFCGHIILSDEKQVKPLKESIVDNSRNKLNSGYVSIANAFGHELADPLCSQNKVLSKGDFTKRFAANYFAKNTGGFIVGKALSLCSRTVSFVAKKCGGLVSSGCVAVGLLKEETRQSWSFAYKGMKKIVAKMIYDVSRGKRIEGLSRVKAMHLTRLSQSLRFGLGDPFAFQKGFSPGVVTRGFGRKIAMDVCKTVLKTDFGKNYLSSPTVDLSITTSGCNVPKYLVWALGWILTSPVDHLLQAHYDFDQLLPTESALSLLVKKNEIYPTKQELFALACKVGIKDVQEDKIENFSLEEGKMVKQVIISMVTDSELLGLVSQFDYSSLLQMKSRAGLIF